MQTYLKHGAWLCLIWILLAWYSAPAFSKSQAESIPSTIEYRIPMEYDALITPTPIVYLRVNGTSLPFMLDTGSSFLLLIDSWASKRLHLSPNGRKARISNANKTADVADLKHVELIGKYAKTNQNTILSVAVMDAVIADLDIPANFPYKDRVAGVVGISLFTAWNIRFDFANQSLALFPPSDKHIQIKAATVLPLRKLDTRYTVPAKSVAGASIDLLVDTGSPWLFMPETVAHQFQLATTPVVLTDVWSVQGSQTSKMLLVRTLQLESLTEANVPAVVTESDSQRSVLGMNFLTRFRVTMDFGHQEMLLERSADYAQRVRMPGLPSVLVAKQQGEYVIYDVLPNSAAAQAGILPGDSVVRVDDQLLTTLSPASVQNLLNGYADTKADVLVKRTGQSQHIYTRQSIFSMASGRGVGVGIGVAVSNKGELLIDTVDARSPAQEAGIQKGDQIMAINNLPVLSTPFQQLAAEMKKPEGATITLQIRRKGENKLHEFRLVVRKLL